MPTGSQEIDEETPLDEKRRVGSLALVCNIIMWIYNLYKHSLINVFWFKLRKCTLFIDDTEKCVFYPSAAAGGQVLAMNGTPTIEVVLSHCII